MPTVFEIWEPQTPGNLRACQACNGIALPELLLTNIIRSTMRRQDPVNTQGKKEEMNKKKLQSQNLDSKIDCEARDVKTG